LNAIQTLPDNRATNPPTVTPERGGLMPKGILIEQFRLSVFALRKLPNAEYTKIHKTLNRMRFRNRLQRVLRRLFRRYLSLAKVMIKVLQ